MEKINVRVEKEIYRKPEDEFYIYLGRIIDTEERISIKTRGFELIPGQKCLNGIMGKWGETKSFQCHYEEFDNDDPQSMINLLCSIKGIQVKTATKIVNQIDSLEVFRQEKPPKIKGIGEKKLELIRQGIKRLDEMATFREVNKLCGNLCSPSKIQDITQAIEDLEIPVETFKMNPFKVLIDHVEMGFKQADKIFLGIGGTTSDPNRLLYLTEYLVKQYTLTGNCYIDKDLLAEKLTDCNYTRFEAKVFIEDNSRLVIEENNVYTKDIYKAEKESPILLKNMLNKEVETWRLEQYDIQKMITEFEKANKITFDQFQVEAIKTAINNNVSVITGGAGSGKTTLLKCVMYCLKELRFKLVLTAPTGKASRRMSEATGEEAGTIHSFLYGNDCSISPSSVMIVDESSMIDIELFYELLEKIQGFAKLIIVGDPGQLPSVAPGNVLNDLIKSKTMPLVTLTKTFRQAGDSNILDIALKTRKQEVFSYIKKKDFFCKTCFTPKDFIKDAIYFYEYISDKYKNKGLDTFFSEVQIISPVKKGEAGVNKLNEVIKEKINPKKDKNDKFPFDVNDKVMNTKNDKEAGVMNGEFGRITEITKDTFTIYFDNLDRFISFKKSFEEINKFILAYASTVHKLQGSEFKYIIIVVPQDSLICDSRLLYTAITRGKQTCILLSNKELTDKICKRNNEIKRNTQLEKRLVETFKDNKDKFKVV